MQHLHTYSEVDSVTDCIQHGSGHVLMVLPYRAALELELILTKFWAQTVHIDKNKELTL